MNDAAADSGTSMVRDIPPLVVAFVIAGALVAGIAVISYLTGADWDLFKVGNESNVPTWYSASQLFTIGLVLSPLAARDMKGRTPRSFALVLVPGLFFFLSLDEIATIHERLGVWLKSQGFGTDLRTDPWMFVFVPLVAVVGAVALWAFWPYIRSRNDVVILGIAGVAVFALSAVGLEFTANYVDEGSKAQQILGFLEEYGEMIAASLLLWSAVLVTRYEGIRLDVGEART